MGIILLFVSVSDLMSDSNSTLTVYTAPGQPTLTLTTLSSSAIQIDATLNGGDRDTADVTIDVYRKLGTTEQGAAKYTLRKATEFCLY